MSNDLQHCFYAVRLCTVGDFIGRFAEDSETILRDYLKNGPQNTRAICLIPGKIGSVCNFGSVFNPAELCMVCVVLIQY